MGADGASSLREFVPDRIWLAEYGVRYAAMSLRARTTIVRLGNGDLFVHSPCPLNATLRSQLAGIGRVAHVVAPGMYHHLHVAAWMDAYPTAQLWLCPGLRAKRPKLPPGQELSDEPPAAWRSELDQVVIRGNRLLWEVVFVDHVSRTLIVTDSVELYGDATPDVPWMLRVWWYLFGMWNRPAPAPEYRFGWCDRKAARRSLQRVLKWDFDRIVLSHGDLIEHDGRACAAQAWRSLVGAVPGGGFARRRRARGAPGA